MSKKKIRLRITTTQGPGQAKIVRECDVSDAAKTVAEALNEANLKGVTIHGESFAPVAWDDSGCASSQCASCLMLINGLPGLACRTEVSSLAWPIELKPLANFPLLRDLLVDRTQILLELASAYDQTVNRQLFSSYLPHFGKGFSSQHLPLDNGGDCTYCGACVPHDERALAPAVLHRLWQEYCAAQENRNKHAILKSVLEHGGVPYDLKASHNYCPEKIDLQTSLAKLNRELTRQMLSDFFG